MIQNLSLSLVFLCGQGRVNSVLIPTLLQHAAKEVNTVFSLYWQKIPDGVENTNGELKPKPRQRWGHITKTVKGAEDWDDLEDLDFNSSLSKTDLKNKKRQTNEGLCR